MIVRKVNVKGLVNASGEGDGLVKVWLGLVWVKDPDLGATPNEAEIFDQSQASDCWIAPRNNSFLSEYKVLKVKKMLLSNNTNNGTIPQVLPFNMTLSFPRGFTVRYAAGNASSITQGKLFFCYWANNATAVNGSPIIEFYNRTYFVEG